MEYSITFLARGVWGSLPMVTMSGPDCTIFSTSRRILRRSMSRFFNTLAATPEPSLTRPRRMCSVPIYSWLKRWASWLASCMTLRARSVKRSYIPAVSDFPRFRRGGRARPGDTERALVKMSYVDWPVSSMPTGSQPSVAAPWIAIRALTRFPIQEASCRAPFQLPVSPPRRRRSWEHGGGCEGVIRDRPSVLYVPHGPASMGPPADFPAVRFDLATASSPRPTRAEPAGSVPWMPALPAATPNHIIRNHGPAANSTPRTLAAGQPADLRKYRLCKRGTV